MKGVSQTSETTAPRHQTTSSNLQGDMLTHVHAFSLRYSHTKLQIKKKKSFLEVLGFKA